MNDITPSCGQVRLVERRHWIERNKKKGEEEGEEKGREKDRNQESEKK